MSDSSLRIDARPVAMSFKKALNCIPDGIRAKHRTKLHRLDGEALTDGDVESPSNCRQESRHNLRWLG